MASIICGSLAFTNFFYFGAIALLALIPAALAGGRYANAVADVSASSTIAAPRVPAA